MNLCIQSNMNLNNLKAGFSMCLVHCASPFQISSPVLILYSEKKIIKNMWTMYLKIRAQKLNWSTIV